jgi:hypothetical protein
VNHRFVVNASVASIDIDIHKRLRSVEDVVPFQGCEGLGLTRVSVEGSVVESFTNLIRSLPFVDGD